MASSARLRPRWLPPLWLPTFYLVLMWMSDSRILRHTFLQAFSIVDLFNVFWSGLVTISCFYFCVSGVVYVLSNPLYLILVKSIVSSL